MVSMSRSLAQSKALKPATLLCGISAREQVRLTGVVCGVRQVLVSHRIRFSVCFWAEEACLVFVQSILRCQGTVYSIKHCWSFLEPFLFFTSSFAGVESGGAF